MPAITSNALINYPHIEDINSKNTKNENVVNLIDKIK